jgi:dipeptidyl-peptidase-4
MLTSTAVRADDRALREQMFDRYLDLASQVRGGTIEPHWLADGSSFWFDEGAPDHTIIYTVAPGAGTKSPLVDPKRLSAALEGLLGHGLPSDGLPFESFTYEDDHSVIVFQMGGQNYRLRLSDYSLTAVPTPSAEEAQRGVPLPVGKPFYVHEPQLYEVPTPDGAWLATLTGSNLAIRSAYDGRTETITSDGTDEFAWTSKGAVWSPDGYEVATRKIDKRKVPYIPLVHWLKPVEEVEWVHYTKAGSPIPQEEMYIVDRVSRRAVRVDTGTALDESLAVAAWRPDKSEVLIYRHNRTNSRLDLLAAHPDTGTTRPVLTESTNTFLQTGYTENPKATLLKDGKRFIWTSQRDGWNQLYLYDIAGKLIRQLTHGHFPVLQVIAIDNEAGWVYFSAHSNPRRPYDTHLCRVNLDGHGFQQLTEADGQHDTRMSPSVKYFIDIHESIDRPPQSDLRDTAGHLLQTLSKANIDGLRAFHWRAPEEFIAKAADGTTDLYGIVYKPFDFDEHKKYPVIEVIYGGPQVEIVQKTFTGKWQLPYGQMGAALAQLGFIVCTVDARGTPERGKAFHDVVYLNFGHYEIPDHVAVLRQLFERFPYMDGSRLGLIGGSWGGYMAIRGMLLAPGFYKVAVAEFPVVDLYDHSAQAIEQWMGLPQEHPEAYAAASSLRLAGALQGKLMLVHGTSDVNATFSATVKMIEALTRSGKPYDLVIVPEQPHDFSGLSGRYVVETVKRYFTENLQP